MMLRCARGLSPDDVSGLKNLGHVILKLGMRGRGCIFCGGLRNWRLTTRTRTTRLGTPCCGWNGCRRRSLAMLVSRSRSPTRARAYFAPASVLLMNGQ